jgi:hypothetical protein
MNRVDEYYYFPAELEYRRQGAIVKRGNRRWPWSSSARSGGRRSRELH